MIGRLLYMIPFFGMLVGTYFVFTLNIAAAYLLAGLGLTQSIICFGYLTLQIAANGTTGTLEVEVQLWDALMPIIFLMISFMSFLLVTTYNIELIKEVI